MKKHDYRIRARYSEVDAMGFLHNSVYLVFFEEARTDLVRSLGYPYARIEEEGIILPISEAKLEYKKPIRYDEEVRVEVSIDYMRGFSIKFCYAVFGNDDELRCKGSTIHAALDKRTQNFAEVPDEIRELLAPYVVKKQKK